MSFERMFDARKIHDEVINYLRRIAVRVIEEKHYSPDLVADLFGIDRTSIYDWLRNDHHRGEEALDTRKAPGAPWVITPDIDAWMKKTILHSTPQERDLVASKAGMHLSEALCKNTQKQDYNTVLWTSKIMVDLLKKRFDLWVSPSTVNLHLHALGLRVKKPCYRAFGRDPAKIKKFINEEFKEIQKVAQELTGRTWGLVCQPPEVKACDEKDGDHMLSMVTADGELMFQITTEKLNSSVYIEFLKKVLRGRTRPLIVIDNRASYHTSKEVKQFAEDHAQKIRLFFLPPHSSEINPDEQVWNEIKHRQLEKQPIKGLIDFEHRLYAALLKLQNLKEIIQSFFKLPDTQYAGLKPSPA
ncbi:MAG: IS630 family transposase [Gammaproteobacteria bacterium]|nr:IS630 family transposase [Gammaproteobacteria bacterium]